jgi:hypothetical protein
LKRLIKHFKQGVFLDNIFRIVLKRLKYNQAYIYYLNTSNRVKYGLSAPRFAETMWIEARYETMSLPERVIKESFGNLRLVASGEVIESVWPVERIRPYMSKRIKFCIEHWVNGVPWKDTGIYDHIYREVKKEGSKDGCKSFDDIVRRYDNLDAIFEQASLEGRLRTKEEIDPTLYWDKLEEAKVHIGPDGKPFLAEYGYHRFAIALILKIPFPAEIGLVHISSLPYLDRYRKQR